MAQSYGTLILDPATLTLSDPVTPQWSPTSRIDASYGGWDMAA